MSLWWMVMACTSQPEKRSVLLLMVDRLRADEVGAYGSLPSDTPSIDALAKSGTLFTRAYATSTLAGPARTSVITGEVPPVHGHRLDEPPAGVEKQGWIAELLGRGWSKCDVTLASSDSERSTTKLEECLKAESILAVVDIEAGAVADVDQTIGIVSRLWNESHADGLGVLVRVTGNLTQARYDASMLITDDLVRVPLVVWGTGWEADWEVSDLVSTIDVGSTVLSELEQSTDGPSLKSGGSELAYHESLTGYQAFRTRPLFGFTAELGRYVHGVHGRWYPAGKASVRAFEDPESEYREHADQLAVLQQGFTRDVGLSLESLSITLDPLERVGQMSLVTKIYRFLERGQLAAADRLLARLSVKAPDAPILEVLRQRRNAYDVKP